MLKELHHKALAPSRGAGARPEPYFFGRSAFRCWKKERDKKMCFSWLPVQIRELFLKPMLWLAHDMYGHKIFEGSLAIIGDREFCERLRSTINLLRQKDRPTAKEVDSFLKYVLQSPKSALRYLHDGAILAIEQRVEDVSDEWLACLLAYYAFRAKCFYARKARSTSFLPALKSKDVLDKAYEAMYSCLRKIGGSYEDLKYLNEFIETKVKI